METSILQIKATMNSVISRQHQEEERISDMEVKIKEILHSNNHKKLIHMHTMYKNSGT
jgi:hypothetical protein